MRSIAFYGKGGIGKSTVVANLAYLMAQRGHRVLQVGCDPKHDSAMKHVAGDQIRTVMDEFEKRPGVRKDSVWLESLIMVARNGVHCLETGGPEPGKGCAGRAISIVVQVFKDLPSFCHRYDFVLFDVLGDVVCGGFASPIRLGMASEIYIVTSGEAMALYAANNISKGVLNLSGEPPRLGLIANFRNTPGETPILDGFSKLIGIDVVGRIPRSDRVVVAELEGLTAAERFPDDEVSRAYSALLENLLAPPNGKGGRVIPVPPGRLDALYKEQLKFLLHHD